MNRLITYVALVVDDYDRGIAYYTSILGFHLIEDTRLSESKRWVVVSPSKKAETRLLLAKAKNSEESTRVGNQTGGRVFLFLQTEDFWRDYRIYLGRSVKFIRDPQNESYGTVAVFIDIFGNKWDLIQFH